MCYCDSLQIPNGQTSGEDKFLQPDFESKHAPITATFKSSFVEVGKGKMLSHPKTYKWDSPGAVLFHSLLNQKVTQEKENKKPREPWYSEKCSLLRKQFTRIAKLLQKDPKNLYMIGQYQIIKKSCKHMIKISKRH